MHRLPVVAIIGRPNVGKSSLFNRIIGKRHAIVERNSRTTRDRLCAVCSWKQKSFELVDTGGWTLGSRERIHNLVNAQVNLAIETADILIFVCDAAAGITGLDEEVASVLRKSAKRVFLAANKADNEDIKFATPQFYKFGISDRVYPVSALHGNGIRELLDNVSGELEQGLPACSGKDLIKIAIVGRPNVGKSSFLNRLLNEDRVIVDEAPGTTRDSVDTLFIKDGRQFLLIDTAGIKHKKKLKDTVSFYSLSRSKEAIRRSDVCLFLMDAYQGPTVDDLKIADYILECGKGMAIAFNKWDLTNGIEMSKYKQAFYRRAPFLYFVPLLFISALKDKNLLSAVDKAQDVAGNCALQVETRKLNDTLQNLREQKSAPVISGRRPKIYYGIQKDIRPPAFEIFSNHPALIKDEYTRFLERGIRGGFGFEGAPIRITYRKK